MAVDGRVSTGSPAARGLSSWRLIRSGGVRPVGHARAVSDAGAHQRDAAVYLVVPTVTGVVVVLLWVRPAGPVLWVHVLFASFAVVAFGCDLRHARIPNRVTALGAGSVLLAWWAVGADLDDHGVFRAALVGALLFALILLVPHLLRPASIGLGDVKLALMLGALLGPYDLALVPVAALVAQALQLSAANVAGRRRLPFAPALIVATTLCLGAGWAFLRDQTAWHPAAAVAESTTDGVGP